MVITAIPKRFALSATLLVAALGQPACAAAPADTRDETAAHNERDELSQEAKDTLIRETERFLSAMRSVERQTTPETDDDDRAWLAAKDRAEDHILGIYYGWTSEILTYGGSCEGKIENGIVTGPAVAGGVHVSRYGFSPSGARGIQEGTKLVAEWKKRILAEYGEALLTGKVERDASQGESPKPGQSVPLTEGSPERRVERGVIHVTDLPSLEALLHLYGVLSRKEMIENTTKPEGADAIPTSRRRD